MENLNSAPKNTDAHNAELQNALQTVNACNSEIARLQSRKRQLEEALIEEKARSEYLWCESLELRNSLALRIFGRWQLRKKVRKCLFTTAEFMHKAAKTLLRYLPCSYRFKMAGKNFIYSHFGRYLQNIKGYQDWLLRQSILDFNDVANLTLPSGIPMTSIIIPVFDNIELTRKCLNSIYNSGCKVPFEIIIVDDCSSKDDYAALQRDFALIKIIRNEKISGFGAAANRGAANARGEYLLFLNNDAVVMPGWLDELACALYNHSEAGMIGSQLIHQHSEKLCESGNLICRNGDILPQGRGGSPADPQYSYFREVDFCSAASIIMRAQVFSEMKGFDGSCVHAYYEAPDLGLRLQKANYKNYVCPLSRVMHHKTTSYCDTLSTECEKNRQFFLNRWQEYLQTHSLYDDRQDAAVPRYDKKRILYLDAEVPMADRGAGGMDAIFFMEYMLKRGYHVVFHGEYTPGYVPKYTSILLRMGVECIYEPDRRIWEYLAEEGKNFDILFVSRIYQARCFDKLLKQYCSQASYIFNTVDLHFVREALEAELRNDAQLKILAAETKKYELAVAAAADATIVISRDEKKMLEEEFSLSNIYHIPQARRLFGRAAAAAREGAVFIGSAHPPNMDGLRYFHDKILPLLPRDFELTIVGEALKKVMGASDEYKDLLCCSQFNFVGFVEDLGTVLNTARITIAPLRYGAGTKGKVASSMSYGVPCVSSCFGTEGTDMIHGENVMIAGTPEEFANCILALYSDQELWLRISDGGLKFIRDNYSPEIVEKMMDNLLEDVQKRLSDKRSGWSSAAVVPKVG